MQQLHCIDPNPAIDLPVKSPDEGGVFGGRDADTAACKIKRRQKRTMNDDDSNPYRLRRGPSKQAPRPLPSNPSRVKKSVTRKHVNTQRLKPAQSTLTVDAWNVQTSRAAGKLELLRNEMKHFTYDIIDVFEVRWAETVKHQTVISPGQEKRIHTREV